MNIFHLDFSKAVALTDDALEEINEHSYNGILVYAREGADNPPVPWDHGVAIEASPSGPKVVIEGMVGCHGGHRGTCTVRVPREHVNKYYTFVVEPRFDGGAERIKEILAEGGITVTEVEE